MRYTVSAPDVPMHAAIRLPASKSISNRALILHALAHGRQTLCNLSDCDDTRVGRSPTETADAELLVRTLQKA